jgi:hypothetical protein
MYNLGVGRVETEPLAPGSYIFVILDHHNERKGPIDFQGQRSKHFFVENLVGSMVSSRIIQLGTLGHHDERKPIASKDQRSRL